MKTIIRFLIIGACLCIGVALYSVSGGMTARLHASSAERPTVQPLPTDAPTAMPTPAPQSTPSHPISAVKPELLGANIELMPLMLPTPGATNGLRAVVQWQGRDNRWYDVEGWQSVLADKPIDWWVSPNDFGKGPFRWVVYRVSGKQPLHISATFFLPTGAGSRVYVGWPR